VGETIWRAPRSNEMPVASTRPLVVAPAGLEPGQDNGSGAAVAEQVVVTRVSAEGPRLPELRWIASETPIAFEINGLGYAVLLATPDDLADLALGFALSERLIDEASELLDLDIFVRERDAIVRMTLSEPHAARLRGRVRHRATDSSCGLCGIENLEELLRPLPMVTAATNAGDASIFTALQALGDAQQLNRSTHSVHGAAYCDAAGRIVMLREDIGRHNAFDKLIGAMAASGQDWDGGFALLTSRCSFELVEKAVLANCPMLVTVSAPTGLALSRARDAGLSLKVVARPDALLDASAISN
jgi:FdhD protein